MPLIRNQRTVKNRGFLVLKNAIEFLATDWLPNPSFALKYSRPNSGRVLSTSCVGQAQCRRCFLCRRSSGAGSFSFLSEHDAVGLVSLSASRAVSPPKVLTVARLVRPGTVHP